MIGVSIQCRLGNQLFQYAFATALAERLNTNFFLVEGAEKLVLTQYFDLNGYNKIENLIKKLYFKVKTGQLFNSLQGIEIESPEAEFKDNQVYMGYFQSELFFQNIAKQLLTSITIKSKYIKNYNKLYRNLYAQEKIIAVHIRRGDYLKLGYWWKENLGSDNLSLPLAYYRRCLATVDDLSSYKIVLVSDDIDFVKKNFAKLDNVVFASNDIMTDFQILLNADICVLSNSSFSWWAAYLNPKKNKKVFCPKHWLGFKIKKEYPPNIITEQWQQIEAN